MRSIAVALLGVVATATACRGREGPVAGVDDSTFVTAMVELHKVDSMRTRDTAAIAAARRAVLAKHGLTSERLERAARALADDPERASALWSTINRQLTTAKTKPPHVQKLPPTPQKSPPIRLQMKRRGRDTSRSAPPRRS
jgi:hypothetical protein